MLIEKLFMTSIGFGRVRLIESVALVASALLGGLIADLVSLRVTYFLTAPLLVGACLALLAFREPRLHKAEEVDPPRLIHHGQTGSRLP